MQDEVRTPRPRGLAGVDVEKRREIAKLGGVASHQQGKGHQWTAADARAAGRLGGLASNGGKGKNSRPGEALPKPEIVTLGSLTEPVIEEAPKAVKVAKIPRPKGKKTSARKT